VSNVDAAHEFRASMMEMTKAIEQASLQVQVQDTRLRMPNKWHICKEGKAGNEKRQFLVSLNYLAFLRPAADRAVSILPWVVSPGCSYGFLWAVRLFKKM
jgi:hypothetical protein